MAKDVQLLELFSGQRVLTNTFSGHLSLDKLNVVPSHLIDCGQGAANMKSCTPQRLTTTLQSWCRMPWCQVLLPPVLAPRQWFDIDGRGTENDFLGVQGFLFALRDTMRLSPGALLFAGIPCSSFLGLLVWTTTISVILLITYHEHVWLDVSWLMLTLSPPSKLGMDVFKWSFAVQDHPRWWTNLICIHVLTCLNDHPTRIWSAYINGLANHIYIYLLIGQYI